MATTTDLVQGAFLMITNTRGRICLRPPFLQTRDYDHGKYTVRVDGVGIAYIGRIGRIGIDVVEQHCEGV